MGIRESINRRPQVAGTFAIITAVVAVAVIAFANRRPPEAALGDAAYTVDNGKTWFTDTGDRITPFTKDGQVAVGVAMFSSDGGKNRFVGYLKRYGNVVASPGRDWPDRLAQLPGAEGTELQYSLQVKPPLAPDSAWTTAATPQGNAIMDVKSADGKPAVEVEP